MVLQIKSKPLSVNSMYYRNKSAFGMRSEAKDWQVNVFHGLSQYEAELGELRRSFKVGKHGYKVDITYFFPAEILYNRAGEPSSKAQDLSNCDKALIDCLFLPKNFSNTAPYGCQNLCIDDKHLFALSSKKMPAQDYYIELSIEIINLP